jgi:LysW-gamma-L-lysine carboxypeptidase
LAVACWTALLDLLGPDAAHSTFGQPGATLCQLNGDLTSATAELSIRTPPGFDVDTLVRSLRDRLPAGELDVLNSVAACRVSRANPVVRALGSGIRRLHATPRLMVKTATSDMNTLAEVWDVPMATYGPGDSRLDHADDEHIVLSDYLRGIDVLSIAISELARLPVRLDQRALGASLPEGIPR